MDGFTRISQVGFIRRLFGHAADAPPEPLKAASGTRVLVVDDSPTICAVLGRYLEQDGYDVIKAHDGEAALDRVHDDQPALVFLDVVMPGMNGFAVLRKLRHDIATAGLPIVMISGNPQATEQLYLQRYGADDFLKKPFSQQQVRDSIGELVQAGRLPARIAPPGLGLESPLVIKPAA